MGFRSQGESSSIIFMKDYPRPPFILGITGNMDPIGYGTPDGDSRIKAGLQRVLDWLIASDRWLDPETGDLLMGQPPIDKRHWKALGLGETPIIVLSSLAPGADTLAAEAALEYAAAHPDLSIFVRAPLPFPIAEYRQASTFPTPADLVRLDALVDSLGRQKNWDPCRDLFEVELENDPARAPLLNPTTDPPAVADLTALDLKSGKPRRYLRYRAAGEFVATHSDLLLAIHDPVHDEAILGNPPDRAKLASLFESGTAAIVEAKRRGLSFELLAIANNFSWADNGPVLRIPVKRLKNPSPDPVPGTLALLYPYDSKPKPDIHRDDEPAWVAHGDQIFRKILALQGAFHALAPRGNEIGELVKMTTQDPKLQDPVLPLSPSAQSFVNRLEPLARVRSRAVTVSRETEARREKLFRRLLHFIFAAALGVGMFEHWHHSEHHGHEEHGLFTHDFMSWTQGLLLSGVLYCLGRSAWLFYRHCKGGDERTRHDYRALGEGLRVQMYWCLTGTGRAVSADYMQRQRNELDWIRFSISSLSFPFECWRRSFFDLDATARCQVLQVAHVKWIQGQRKYYESGAKKNHRAAAVAHFKAWSYATAGIVSLLFLLLAEVSPFVKDCLVSQPGWFFILLLMAGLSIWQPHPLFPGKGGEDHGEDGKEEQGDDTLLREGFLAWLLLRREWGTGLVIAAPVIALPHLLHHVTHFWPDWNNWWIILTGTALLTGGLILAASERQFHHEHSRQYRAMRGLFHCADQRLTLLLARLEGLPVSDPEYDRLLSEIHNLFYQVGCEALDENAEWLILHRARPLEPFMAG